MGSEKLDQLASGQPRGFIEILVEAHADVVRGCFRARPAKPLTLAHADFESSPERCLERRAGHFAIALHAVAVANRKQGALHVHRQIQDRACDEILVVEITAMPAWRTARDSFDERRRRDADRGKGGSEVERHAGTELDAVGTGLPAQQTKVRVWKVARNDSATRVERHDAERMQTLSAHA